MSPITSQINNFPTILASSIHDIKNSLSTVRELIDQLAKREGVAETPEFRQLEFEASRMNSSLMQLLILYKIDSALFSPVIDEYQVKDILDDVAAQQRGLLALSGIVLTAECPDDLYCYCDNGLINTVLISMVNNAQRYCRKMIFLSAYQSGDGVCFQVEDDGEGYPEEFVVNPAHPTAQGPGNTGLGLFFAATIAQLHNNGGQKGFVRIDNDSRFQGARFRLFLP